MADEFNDAAVKLVNNFEKCEEIVRKVAQTLRATAKMYEDKGYNRGLEAAVDAVDGVRGASDALDEAIHRIRALIFKPKEME